MQLRLHGWLLFVLISSLAACVSISEDPRSKTEKAEDYVHLASEYFRLGKMEQALNYLKKAERLDYEYYPAHSMLAIVYDKLGRTSDAEKYFTNAIELVSEDSHEYGAIHNNFGAFLCAHGRYNDAEQQFQLSIANRLYNTPELAYENAGLCVLRQGKFAKAENYFQYSLKLNPVMPRSLFAMAELMMEQKDSFRARAFIQRYHDATQESSASLWLGMKIESALGDRKAAAEYANRLKEQFPSSDEAKKLRMSGN